MSADAAYKVLTGEQMRALEADRFEGAEVWGADTTASSICADCWESYLEPAGR